MTFVLERKAVEVPQQADTLNLNLNLRSTVRRPASIGLAGLARSRRTAITNPHVRVLGCHLVPPLAEQPMPLWTSGDGGFRGGSIPFARQAGAPLSPVSQTHTGVVRRELVAVLAMRQVGWSAPTVGGRVHGRRYQRPMRRVLAPAVRTSDAPHACARIVAGVVDHGFIRNRPVQVRPAVPVGKGRTSPGTVVEGPPELSVTALSQGGEPRPALVGSALADLLDVPFVHGVVGAAQDADFQGAVAFDSGPVGAAVAVGDDDFGAVVCLADGADSFAFGHGRESRADSNAMANDRAIP